MCFHLRSVASRVFGVNTTPWRASSIQLRVQRAEKIVLCAAYTWSFDVPAEVKIKRVDLVVVAMLPQADPAAVVPGLAKARAT